ncbi:class I SAM-dependent methyltransferase [Lutibacter sp. B1]|uniref:class I SAM-dependent methyltransferase n=1 Tax=Lutibacter sp. B1 TaxID=2725996 RepID=UPI001B3A7908|nr:class I SAM-dependent methyltransferase [Lutibacter sp. B1]
MQKRSLEKKEIEIRLDLYDGTVFPYKDNTFDKIVSSLVFHQLDKQTKNSCLNEIFRVLKPNGELIIGDWGEAKSKLMRIRFYIVQLLDGFKTTKDNVEGLIPNYMINAGFKNVEELSYINTKIGSYCYYKGNKHYLANAIRIMRHT